MRKICLFIVMGAFLLMISLSFAQSPRDGTSSEGKTTFTNIAVVGLNKDGTDGLKNPGLPGYIEMVNTAGSKFYLFIGYDGKLRVASEPVMGQGASPNTVGWGDGASSVVVGAQLP